MESPDWVACTSYDPRYARVVGWAVDEPFAFALIDSNGDRLEVSFELLERQAIGWRVIDSMDDVSGDGPGSGRSYPDVVWAYGRGTPGDLVLVQHRGKAHQIHIPENGWWAFIRRTGAGEAQDVPRALKGGYPRDEAGRFREPEPPPGWAEKQEMWRARRRAGVELAKVLIGLSEGAAIDEARRAGFEPVVVRERYVTADLRPNRIRIWLDDAGSVTRATSG